MYIAFALLSAFFLGCYDVLKKISLKKSNIYETLFFYCLSGFFLSLVFIKDMMMVSLFDVIIIFLKSLVIVVNWLLVIKSMAKLDVSIVVSFSLLSSILVILFSYLFFHEQITWWHFVSLFFISLGVILTTFLDKKTHKEDGKKHYRYFVLLIISVFLSALTILIDKYLINIQKIKNGAVLVWLLFFVSLIYGVIYFIKNKRIEWIKLKTNYPLILTGICLFVSDVVYYLSISITGAQVSIISILRKCSVIVATILASLFLKEKYLLKKIGVLFIMLIGIAIPIIFI